MSFTLSASTGIVGFETNEVGHLVFGRINSVPPAGLDTTTNTYAAGCMIIESATSTNWVNTGTSVSPVWSPAPAGAQQFTQVTVPQGSIPLMFGGTNVQLLPSLPTVNQAYVVNDMVLEYIGVGGTTLGGGGSTTRVLYTGTAGGTTPTTGGTNVAIQVSQGTATIVGGTGTKVWLAAPFAGATGLVAIPGAALYLDNTGAAYTNFTSQARLRVSLWYAVITTTV